MAQINTTANNGAQFLPIKLIAVGDRKVGKTTLLKKIIDNHFQVKTGKENKSHDLTVVPLTLTVQGQNSQEETVPVHAWDFGEKELLYETCRFFFTQHSLYILVWEPAPNRPPNLDRWLYTIKHAGKNSPVLVVMNKADIHTQYIDKASLEKEYPNIIDFFQVSCVTGKGIPGLIERVRTVLGSLAHEQEGPVQGRDRIISRLREEKGEYIPANRYFTICKDHGLTLHQARSLSKHLHDTGLLFHFQEDPLLENIVILEGKWITAAVYKLMENPGIRENKGVFFFDEFARCLEGRRYPREIHTPLMRLMERFELCFNIDCGSRYMIPRLLPERPPIKTDADKELKKLSLQYHYKYMPETITGHLATRLFYLNEDNRYWKNCLELKYENSRAKVFSLPEKQILTISVEGDWESELLGIVKSHIRHVHSRVSMEKGRHYVEKVPCVCTECMESTEPHLYEYDMLKKLDEKKDAVFRNCPKSLEDVEINVLLRGVSSAAKESRLIREVISETKGAVLDYIKTPKDIIRHVLAGENIKSHFTSLSIDKYRVLEDLEINHLNRVNIFAGINNSGKSSLLEAIYLLTNLNNVYAFFEIAGTRGKFTGGVDPQWIDNHFRDHFKIAGVFDNHKASTKINWKCEDDENLDKTRYLSTLKMEAGFKEETFGSKTQLFRDEAPKSFMDSIKVLCNSVFSSPFSLHDREDQIAFHKKSIESKNINKIITFFRDYIDTHINWIKYDGDRFKVDHTFFDRAKDLTLFGEGMQRIFHICLQFASAQDGVLLIDEMENAIHYELLEHFARFIGELALEFNTQVFITSHSKECIDAFFQDEFRQKELTGYRLFREENRIAYEFIRGPRMGRLIKSINADLRGEK